MKWELAEEQMGTMGDGSTQMPVMYPRSDAVRGQLSDSNKGAASVEGNVKQSVATNNTGNVNVPRNGADVVYKVGTYPSVEDIGGVDEGDGASR